MAVLIRALRGLFNISNINTGGQILYSRTSTYVEMWNSKQFVSTLHIDIYT